MDKQTEKRWYTVFEQGANGSWGVVFDGHTTEEAARKMVRDIEADGWRASLTMGKGDGTFLYQTAAKGAR